MRHATLTRPETIHRFPDLLDMRRWFDSFPSLLGPWDTIRLEEEMRDDAYVVRAEIPGIDPDEDAEIWVADGVLHIEVERECETRETDGEFRTEFRYGSFHRAVMLPDGVSTDEVRASYHDGVLEVRLAKRTTEAPIAKIPITKD